MKYEVIPIGHRLEAFAAHSGYRIRMSTVPSAPVSSWPLTVHIRGSESEDEVAVDVPAKHLTSATDAFDYGYDCAVQWIDALDHRDPIR